jgi:hypothetical protein
MPLMEFKPTITAGERSKAHALDRAATGTGYGIMENNLIKAGT